MIIINGIEMDDGLDESEPPFVDDRQPNGPPENATPGDTWGAYIFNGEWWVIYA